jgi:hypothetical protein
MSLPALTQKQESPAVPVRGRAIHARGEDIFFTAASLVVLAFVLVGFAPTYFLRGAVFAHLPSLLVHVHGAIFSTWILLFVVQTLLVAAGNVRVHRKLGVFGAVLAGLMVVFGILAVFGTLRRGAVLPPFFTPASFLVNNALAMLFFGAVVAVAIMRRNNRTVHKRLILLANVVLLPPALSRIPFVVHRPVLIFGVPLGIMVALFLFDLATRRRVLAVTLTSLVLFLALNPVMASVTKTKFAQRLTLWAQHRP